jgi:FkbM family methyltransferase
MTVLEVGANVGFFTLITSRAVGPRGRVFAFEADPALAQIARDNVEINGEHRVAEIINAAVSDRDGTATFHTSDRHRGNGTLVANLEQLAHNASDRRSSIEVPCMTLDGFAEGRTIDRVDLIRIDAEGSESAILRGASGIIARSKTLTMMLEFTPRFFRAAGGDPERELSQLASAGFRIARLDERTRRIVPTTIPELLARDTSELVCRRGN